MSPEVASLGEGKGLLVTGATGLVGAELLDRLRDSGWNGPVVGVSRHGSGKARPAVVRWDMGAEPPPSELRREWGVIVNAAADIRWTMSAEEARSANVESVRGLLPLVSSDTHVIQISTAYAVGLRSDVESPDLDDYRNTYEWSKAAAERLARDLFDRVTVVRPPLIIGRRRDGRAARFAGIYTLLRGFASSSMPAIVANPDAYFDAIPVDDLAALVLELADGPRGEGDDVVTIAAGSSAPHVGSVVETMIKSLNAWRLERGHDTLPVPRIISPESWNRFLLPLAREHLSPRQLKILELLRNYEPYMSLTSAIAADREVTGTEACLDACVRFWADTHPRVAALAPRLWSATPAREDAVCRT